MVDGYGRQIAYLRISITDRCDFRCQYCMAEDMSFLPRSQVLTIEEILRIAELFTDLGVRKIRVTGGEPLIRKGVEALFAGLGRLEALQELALTTNGSQLASQCAMLKRSGVTSINISLDSLRADRFREITRVGRIDPVLEGIDCAIAAGFRRIRLNAVILDGLNRDEVLPLVHFAVSKGIDLAFIEEMPLGQVTVGGKKLAFVPSDELMEEIGRHYELNQLSSTTIGGPAQTFSLRGTQSTVGFISPHSHNFCATCNRLRISAEGRLLLCLGNEHSIDLREMMRTGLSDAEIKDAIIASLAMKPERHVFDQPDQPQIMRFMNATGG